VPAVAVMTGQQGTYVFIVQPDSTASMRKVTVEREAGDVAVISGDVKPGEQVVTDGQMLLRQGARVQIRSSATAERRESS
jgi:multidrug efflux system membrane fusion protein